MVQKLLVVAASLGMTPACADPPEWAGKGKGHDKGEWHDKGKGHDRADEGGRGDGRHFGEEQRTRIGRTGPNQRLGAGAILGTRAWDQQGAFELDLGPLTLEQFRDFLPTGRGFRPLCDLVRFHRSPLANNGPWFRPEDVPPDYGVGLPTVYLVWIGVVLVLYPPCRWFARLKRRSGNRWLSYV